MKMAGHTGPANTLYYYMHSLLSIGSSVALLRLNAFILDSFTSILDILTGAFDGFASDEAKESD